MKRTIMMLAVSVSVAATHASPNFLVILTDDQSWVGTSLEMVPGNPDTKSDYFKTPNMDALMSGGMRFADGYAGGAWCTPSRRSIQSGRSTSQHIYNQSPDRNEAAFAKWLSIPHALKAANPAYACAHFGKWHLMYDGITPETLGYDASDGDTENGDGELASQTGAPAATPKDVPDVWDDPKTIFSLTRRTGDFIEAQTRANRPWFVQLSHYAVHLKISCRPETLDRLKDRPLGQKHAIPEFAAMTEDLDAGIGELMARLRQLGVLDNTYVIFLSDNGGRGKMPVAGKTEPAEEPGKNYPLAASKHSIYEGGIRVPFAIRGPGIKPGSVSRVPVSGVDILPTIADWAGYTGDLGTIDGGSFKSVALGKSTAVKRPRDFLVFESEGRELPRNTEKAKRSDYKAALRQGDFKLIKFYGGPGDGLTEFYNLSEDLGENRNLAATMPEAAAKMAKLLDAYLADVGGLVKAEEGGKKGRQKAAGDD